MEKALSSGTLGTDTLDNAESNPPCISQIFTDAALYAKLLVREGCFRCPQNRGTKSDDVDDFEDLVGRDLSSSEHAVAARLAKLSVTTETWTSTELTEEPESYAGDLQSGDKTPSDASTIDVLPKTPPRRSSGDKSWQFPPDNIIELLVQEFGALAAEGEQEELILEADAGLFLDVVIVGVVHLTTHRLTFHASLLAARPDLLPSLQVIKSGPAIIHHKGLHPKRRVWLELSHDMICTYNSSREEDRIHPFRTVLLSSIIEVGPVDPKNPKVVHILFHRGSKDTNGVVGFTTEEAANDWRREIQGAVFLYKHRRRRALDGSAESSTGVRLSIPLHRIKEVGFHSNCLNFASIASLEVPLSQIEPDHFSLPETPNEDSPVVHLRVCPIMPVPQWSQLRDYVATAKARQEQNPSDTSETSPVIADFGPLTFSEEDVKAVDSDFISNEERAVRDALALGTASKLWIVRSRVRRGISSSGYFVVSPQIVGFWSKFITQSNIRYRIPISMIKCAKPSSPKICSTNGIVIEMGGHGDLKFEFKTRDIRDEAIRRINNAVEANHANFSLSVSSSSSSTDSSSFLSEDSTLASPSWTGMISPISRSVAAVASIGLPTAQSHIPKAINLPRGMLASRPTSHFVCLTIGSRGDVQPYIALGLRLKKEGHRVTIVTHEEYKNWIEGFGISHRQAGGDPGALMKLSVDNKMFSPEFFRESFTNFRSWLDELLEDSWNGCQDADVLLESPSAMAGVHIAEALKIPYFRTFTMPWTKTSQFPHAFLSPPVNAPTFNSLSYVLFDNVMWTATSGQINKWRRNTLKLDATDMGHLAQSKITFIYNFSQAVVPKPLDWGDTTVISGYWFLDNPDIGWIPPPSLLDWMNQARKDGKPIVYIGFGSVTVPHPNRITKNIVKAVLKSDVRAIISKGWSARMNKDNEPEVEIPPQCYQLDKVPHDWLFPKIDAALHHGGAGTTGASLRAGIPTLIKPWFGDQYFWASRVQQLGAGLKVPSLHVNDLASALTRATTSRIIKEKAARVGEWIRGEDGIHAAVLTIYTYLSRAGKDRKTLD